MEENKKVSIEAATFRRIVKHFQENPEVQNIDLMELSGFCRNCISRWYSEEAEKKGKKIEYEDARSLVYGMTYKEWKKKFQTDQPKDRIENLKESFHKH